MGIALPLCAGTFRPLAAFRSSAATSRVFREEHVPEEEEEEEEEEGGSSMRGGRRVGEDAEVEVEVELEAASDAGTSSGTSPRAGPPRRSTPLSPQVVPRDGAPDLRLVLLGRRSGSGRCAPPRPTACRRGARLRRPRP